MVYNYLRSKISLRLRSSRFGFPTMNWCVKWHHLLAAFPAWFLIVLSRSFHHFVIDFYPFLFRSGRLQLFFNRRNRNEVTARWRHQNITRLNVFGRCESDRDHLGVPSLLWPIANPTPMSVGAIQVLRNAFFLENKIVTHPPPRNSNNFEPNTIVMLFSGKFYTPPPLHYATLEWPRVIAPMNTFPQLKILLPYSHRFISPTISSAYSVDGNVSVHRCWRCAVHRESTVFRPEHLPRCLHPEPRRVRPCKGWLLVQTRLSAYWWALHRWGQIAIYFHVSCMRLQGDLQGKSCSSVLSVPTWMIESDCQNLDASYKHLFSFWSHSFLGVVRIVLQNLGVGDLRNSPGNIPQDSLLSIKWLTHEQEAYYEDEDRFCVELLFWSHIFPDYQHTRIR